MSRRSSLLRVPCLLIALVWSGAAQAQYSLLNGSGLQYQIGNELPLPIWPLFYSSGTAVPPTTTMFPPLLIPPVAGVTVMEAAAPPVPPGPPDLTLFAGAFKRSPANAAKVGVWLANPKIFQARTRLSFSAPGNFPATMTVMFGAGLRTGAMTTVFTGPPAGKSLVRYSKSVRQFGGPGQSKVVALTPPRFWVTSGKAPCKHPAFGGADPTCVAVLADQFLASKAVPGGPVGFVTVSAPPPAMSPGIAVLSVPKVTGLVAMSAAAAMTASMINTASSAGFPWTTGMLTVSAPSAAGSPELFVATGNDNRTLQGQGTVSLVSGALSFRSITGANANRGWLRLNLPEPPAALGAGAALAALAVCHALARRRGR